MILLILALSTASIAAVEKAPKQPIAVRVDFVEALAPRDTTSSARYQQSYEGTIALGAELLGKKLKACGYSLDTRTSFYDASDALKAKEFGIKSAEEGAWLVVGPRRSNHYLLLVQGAGAIPTASIMASSDKVGDLGTRHTTLSPINSKMAAIAAAEANLRTHKGARYVSVVSSDCSNCVDFAKAFDQSAAKLGLKKAGELPITGEAIQAKALRDQVSDLRPDFVLLPNYSKVSSAVMAAFNEDSHPPLFVGGDGWGDSQYGFVQNGLDVQKVNGFTVRGFPPVDKGLSQFNLGREVLRSKRKALSFTPDLSILKIMEETVAELCAVRPKDRTAFLSAFEKQYAKRLEAPWGVSVFDLKRGEIHFDKTVGKGK